MLPALVAALFLCTLAAAQTTANSTLLAPNSTSGPPCVTNSDCVGIGGSCSFGTCTVIVDCTLATLGQCGNSWSAAMKQPLVIGLLVLAIFVFLCCLPAILCCVFRKLFCFAVKAPIRVAGAGIKAVPTIKRNKSEKTRFSTYNPKSAYKNLDRKQHTALTVNTPVQAQRNGYPSPTRQNTNGSFNAPSPRTPNASNPRPMYGDGSNPRPQHQQPYYPPSNERPAGQGSGPRYPPNNQNAGFGNGAPGSGYQPQQQQQQQFGGPRRG
ncbi:hypothetical protein HDU98_010345 [Podochytrium sp. JEL0797]|nr:hypothetical protein HDU98_010345 [Podochytrium sp. JEL0797]